MCIRDRSLSYRLEPAVSTSGAIQSGDPGRKTGGYAGRRTRALPHHQVHQLAGHVDLFDDGLALEMALDVGFGFRGGEDLLFGSVHRDLDQPAQLAEHLNRDIERVFGQKAFVIFRPGFVREGFRVSQALPEFP